MKTINIYLNFDGNCKEAFDFYRSVLGGEFDHVGTFAEMPPQEGMPPIPDDLKDNIMHISLPISKEAILMGSDVIEGFGPKLVMGNNFSISIDADSKEEADRLFAALSVGGHEIMPMAQTFWGSYFGMLSDQFGVNWMVSVDTI